MRRLRTLLQVQQPLHVDVKTNAPPVNWSRDFLLVEGHCERWIGQEDHHIIRLSVHCLQMT